MHVFTLRDLLGSAYLRYSRGKYGVKLPQSYQDELKDMIRYRLDNYDWKCRMVDRNNKHPRGMFVKPRVRYKLKHTVFATPQGIKWVYK